VQTSKEFLKITTSELALRFWSCQNDKSILCIYIKLSGSCIVFLISYVCDILWNGNYIKLLSTNKMVLKHVFRQGKILGIIESIKIDQ
jgi:hypothetical protein